MLKAVTVGLLLTVTPAVAQNQPPANAASQAPRDSKDGENRVICHTEEQIGSRLASKKVCMTAAQWKEHEQQVHDQLDQMHMGTNAAAGPQ